MSTENVAGIGFELTFDGSKLMSRINAACDKVQAKFEQSFQQAADSATKAIQSGNDEIDKILNDAERSAKSKAASIAAIYRKQGDSQEEAFKKAWSHIERNSAQSAERTKKSIRGIGNQSKDTAKQLENNLVGSFGAIAKKAMIAMAAAFSVKEIVAFGKECVELGSDLQEVQNVVDVTFASMSKKVDEFAQSAAGSFGLSETMAKKFVGTFGSMADAFGFSEQQAYDMSTALTGLAGDIASFYNISQDEAYTKLKSVFTGETESLKDLGVVMTQTALDAYALANGFGKTTSAMTEAEKVALRYQFVQDQLSNASGDFERTSGSWANQVRIMNLQLDSIKAKLGQGLIVALTPVIKVVNTLLEKVSELAGAFQSMMEGFFGSDSASAGGAADAAAGLAESTSQTADNLEKASRFLAGFDKIQKISTNTSTSSDSTSSFDFSTEGTSKAEESVDKTVSGITDKLEKLKNYLTNNFKPAAEKVFEAGERVLGDFSDAFDTLWEDVVEPIGEDICMVWQDWGDALDDFWSEYGDPILSGLEDAYEGTADALDKAWTEVIKPIWDKFSEKLDEVWKEHLEPLNREWLEFVGEFTTRTEDIYNDGILPLVNWMTEELGPVYIEYFDRLIEKFDNFMGKATEVTSGTLTALTGLVQFIEGAFTGDMETAMAGLEKIFEGGFDAIGAIAEDPLNQIIEDINQTLADAADTLNWFIEKINKISIGGWSIDIPLVEAPQIPLISAEDGGNHSRNATGGSYGSTQRPSSSTRNKFTAIPMFAEGAYVKANTPQLAIIGDNKHQGEFVVPEGKLYETVLQAAKAAGGGLTRAEMESIINSAVMRIVAALAGMGFYLDSEQVATALQSAEQAIDTRFNPVTPA